MICKAWCDHGQINTISSQCAQKLAAHNAHNSHGNGGKAALIINHWRESTAFHSQFGHKWQKEDARTNTRGLSRMPGFWGEHAS